RTLASVLINDLDATVCLIDLNSPASRSAGPTIVGLFDVLAHEMPIERALHPTADPRLMVLMAGNTDPAAARQLIRSPHLTSAFAMLEERFDYLVFDVPPILGSSDGLAMLRHADAYVMVVRHGVTRVDQLRSMAEEVRSIESLGVIINQYTTNIPKRLRRLFGS
ncbi:MAG: hypothetical protein ABIQ39_02360, partial [Ilumatobacteraceae bacterium]